MFQGPSNSRAFVIHCKGCGENIAAPVETLPSSWIAVKCPLCGDHRRYLSNEIFQGRLSWKLMRKPAKSVGGR
jgi:ribosomal protein S27E